MQASAVFITATFEEILDDLSSRFIINVPEAELSSVERICFQVEQAHWFYEDFIRELRPELSSFQLKTFSARIFKHCPLLHQWAHEHERAYADFMQYRFRIPVCGAIILNANLDKCVLVKGWSSKSGWGFPKGKINQDEEYDCCAIREVLEETGYDIGPLLKKPDFIELTMREQRIRLYIIQGVPEDTQFVPRTRKEISQISWIKLDDLPTYKTTEPKPGNGSLNYVKSGPYRFYMVVPFMNKLRQFVNQRKKSLKKDNHKMKGSASPRPRAPVQSQATPQNAAQQPSIMIPPSPNNKPVESSNALKSLLGVNHGDGNNGFAASPAVSQPQPENQPPQPNTNNLLDQLFAANAQHQQPQQQQEQAPISQQQSPNLLQKLQLASQQASQQAQQTPNQQSGEVHRASFVEELLKQQQYNQQHQQHQHHQQQQQQQQQQSPPLMNDNMRRNSLLSVLQGRSNDSSPAPTNPSMNPLEAFLHAQNQPQPQQQQQSYYAE